MSWMAGASAHDEEAMSSILTRNKIDRRNEAPGVMDCLAKLLRSIEVSYKTMPRLQDRQATASK